MNDKPLTSDVGHEPDGIDARGVAMVLASVAAMVVVVVFVMGGLDAAFFSLSRGQAKAYPTLAPLPSAIPAPRLDADQPRELRDLRALEDNALEAFDWVDRKNGIARIPIERAIELIAEQGLPTRKSGDAGPASRAHPETNKAVTPEQGGGNNSGASTRAGTGAGVSDMALPPPNPKAAGPATRSMPGKNK